MQYYPNWEKLFKKQISVLLVGYLLFFSNVSYAASTDWKLQIKKHTPGAINKDVSQDNISSTICKSGWTATIRPSSSYTNKLKAMQLSTTYASFVKIYGGDLSLYEEDHLISLQLGGDPIDPKNLFPQPYAGNNARKKDVIETKLKKLVCNGSITLKAAQKEIAKSWVVAYNKYVGPADGKLPVDQTN
jgi:hypothetical protein